MDDDEFELVEEQTVVVLPSRPLSRLDLLALGAWAVARITETVSDIADEFADLIAMQVGFKEQRRQLAESAALEIESMIGGDQDG